MAGTADDLKRRLTDRYAAVHSEATRIVVDALKEAAPVAAEGGGALRDSIAATPTAGSTVLVAEVRAAADHASYTNDGTPPHLIQPVNASVLAFDVGGATVFARSVSHPGNVGTHWWDETIAAQEGEAVGRALAAQG